MATPTTSKTDASAAAAKPTAHAASFKAHELRVDPGVCAGALCGWGDAVSLAGIGGQLGQPTRRGLRAIIKILAGGKGDLNPPFEIFGFKKIVSQSDSCYKTLER